MRYSLNILKVELLRCESQDQSLIFISADLQINYNPLQYPRAGLTNLKRSSNDPHIKKWPHFIS